MTALQHIAFGCRDMKASEQFFIKHFGFRRVRTFNKGTQDEFVMLRLGGACLELFQAGNDQQPSKTSEQAPGFRHLAFEVDNLDRAVARLNADGIKTGDIIDCSGIVAGMKVCFFDDLDGNKLEMMQGYLDEVEVR
jgi:glyoxylase I family protein